MSSIKTNWFQQHFTLLLQMIVIIIGMRSTQALCVFWKCFEIEGEGKWVVFFFYLCPSEPVTTESSNTINVFYYALLRLILCDLCAFRGKATFESNAVPYIVESIPLNKIQQCLKVCRKLKVSLAVANTSVHESTIIISQWCASQSCKEEAATLLQEHCCSSTACSRSSG